MDAPNSIEEPSDSRRFPSIGSSVSEKILVLDSAGAVAQCWCYRFEQSTEKKNCHSTTISRSVKQKTEDSR